MTTPAQRSAKHKEGWLNLLLCSLGLAACAALAIAVLNRPGPVVGLRTPIQYDDFAYEVIDHRKEVLAGQCYQVIIFRIHNRARRVEYSFRPEIVRIKSTDGRLFRVSPRGQAALTAAYPSFTPCAQPMPPGTACTTALAFAIPTDVTDTRLVIRHGGWIFALVDDILFGKKSIQLDLRREVTLRGPKRNPL
jgi:hypothetical protein